MDVAGGLEACRVDVDAFLDGFLDRKCAEVADDPAMLDSLAQLRPLLRGGKRLRSQLCHAGAVAFGGVADHGRAGDASPVVRLGTSLELFHAFALVHDDVMDESDVRRGTPSLHRTLEHRYRSAASAARLGVNTALLLGDLVLCWSTELAHEAADDASLPESVHGALRAMRFETMVGQYHDLHAAGTMSTDLERAMTTSRLKTAAYTTYRPLQLGALMVTTRDRVDAAERFSADVGVPLGEAYQLANDLVGAFEDPDRNPSGHDDLRSGKHTVLMAVALRRAGGTRRRRLQELTGDPDLDAESIRTVQQILEEVGARRAVEHLIDRRRERARSVLEGAPITDEGRALLRRLLDLAL